MAICSIDISLTTDICMRICMFALLFRAILSLSLTQCLGILVLLKFYYFHYCYTQLELKSFPIATIRLSLLLPSYYYYYYYIENCVWAVSLLDGKQAASRDNLLPLLQCCCVERLYIRCGRQVVLQADNGIYKPMKRYCGIKTNEIMKSYQLPIWA